MWRTRFPRRPGPAAALGLVLAGAAAAAPPEALVSHFTFDRPEAVADDTGTFDNDGVPRGDAGHTPDALLGAGALRLDGDGDLVELPNTGVDYTTALVADGDGFTLSCWAAVDASPAWELFRFFSTYMPDGFLPEGWGAGHRSADRLLATTYGIKDYDTGGGTAPPHGGWHHYAYVYRHDPIDQVDYYVDRRLVASVATGSTGLTPAAPGTSFAIGTLGLPSSLQYLDGRIDDLRIYDVELTDAEIDALFAEAAGALYDEWASGHGLDPAGDGAPGGDPDLDGATNGQEFDTGTDPTDPDTDGDGLADGAETGTGTYVDPGDTGTDPLDPDTDGDTFPDGDEVLTLGSDPNDPEDPVDSDIDNDGLPNAWEILHGLDPADDGSIDPDNGADGDPDADGLPNREEFGLGSSPVDPADPDGRPWRPRPGRNHLLVVHAHPDDEGIFFGGLLPYATRVRGLNAVLVNMVSDRVTIDPAIREGELRDAAWAYGLRTQPVFARFPDHADFPGGINSLNNAWDAWDGDDTDGVADANGNGIPDGREAGAWFLAAQIRRYRPEVVATHDFAGEYGHGAHQAAGLCSADALTLAADPLVDIDGLPPWPVRKFYVHLYGDRPLFHDFGEAVSIDTDGDGAPDRSPREVADAGLDFHVTQGRPDVSTVHRTGENFDAYPWEWWGLAASTIGDDTPAPDFEVASALYQGWARGDFFEHLTVFPDLDADGLPDAWELAYFPGLAEADAAGDPDGDGRDNGAEFVAGLDPRVPDAPAFAIGMEGAVPVVAFTVPAAAGPGYEGLTRWYRLEVSPDLAGWHGTTAEGPADGVPQAYPVPAGDRRLFYRLVTIIR